MRSFARPIGSRLMRDEKILVGVPPHDRETQIATLPLHFGKVITGSHGGESRDEKDISRYLRLWKTGKLRLESLITERFSLEEINNAIARMRSECAQVLQSADSFFGWIIEPDPSP